VRSRAGILGAAALAFLACTGSSKNEPATQIVSSLSHQERIAVFEDVWKTIADQYYDSTFHNVDWRGVHEKYRPLAEATASDVELYRMFEIMLSELRDAHTSFVHPRAAGDSGFQPPGETGLSLATAEGQTVILDVDSGSDPAIAGVKPGMILRRVNGRTVAELQNEIRSKIAGSSTERAMSQMMNGAILHGGFLGSSREFEIEAFDGALFTVPIRHFQTSATGAVSLTSRLLKSGNGYIRFDEWKTPVDVQFESALDDLKDSRGLIIDLRENGGGETAMILNIASLFFRDSTSFGAFRRRRGTLDVIATHARTDAYARPVAILIDEGSASASEVFAASMQEHGRAQIIGRPSCGCVLNQWTKDEKGGGTLRWSGRIYTSPKGRIVEGAGVFPDQLVPLRISDIRDGADATLLAADQALSRRQ
jgi:carboxyl-terminal processing protease